MEKIALVGAGRVGEAAAQILAKEQMARELMLIALHEGVAQGTALDIQESAGLFGFDTRVRGHHELPAIEGAELIVISAGVPRKPGMSRSDILEANLPVIDSICREAQRSAPNAMLLVVTNPVDVLTHLAWRVVGWDRRRVFGLSGVLDGARMASFVAEAAGVSAKDVQTLVIGGHGDSMVPLPRFSTIGGIPLDHFMGAAAIARIVERTRAGGAEILALKKNSSAYDAPGAAIAVMADAVVHDRKRLLACVAVLNGEYGQHDLAMGVPVVLGRNGIERIVQLELDAAERAALDRSAGAIRADLNRLKQSA